MKILATVDMGFTQSTGDWDLYVDEDERRYISPVEDYAKRDGKEIVIEHRIYIPENQIEPDPAKRPSHVFCRTILSYRDAVEKEISEE